jgi:hypothetical protein
MKRQAKESSLAPATDLGGEIKEVTLSKGRIVQDPNPPSLLQDKKATGGVTGVGHKKRGIKPRDEALELVTLSERAATPRQDAKPHHTDEVGKFGKRSPHTDPCFWKLVAEL